MYHPHITSDSALRWSHVQPPSCIHYEICITKLHREPDISRVNKETYYISVVIRVQEWNFFPLATMKFHSLSQQEYAEQVLTDTRA
jgi:hypothetical protein